MSSFDRVIRASLLALALLVSGCDSAPSPGSADPIQRGYRGVLIDPVPPRPDIVMNDTRGAPFDLRDRTDGRLLFLFVGFTHCPDVCPVQMANLGAVLRANPQWASRTTVVFVTADPDRDTPERLEEWLSAFNPGFVGLRGAHEEVHRLEDALKLPRSAVPEIREGSYSVGHAAQVVAFTPDGTRYLQYPFGTRQEDFAHDIPQLLVDLEDGTR